jgi:NNP family nitrate/nitrite transporter-like MFS transporter
LGWLWVGRYDQLLVVGAMLGVAGASFAVALPMASRWYPAPQQGLVLGIAGAGNCGTAVATLLAPRLAPLVGWRGVFGLAIIPVAVAFVACLVVARDVPQAAKKASWRDYVAVLAQRDTYWFCAFYAVTFGGFVGLCAFLPLFFANQYAISPVSAGLFATLCALVGSLTRPLGGYLSDRLGGVRMLLCFYVALGLLCLILASLPALAGATVALVLVLGLLGMGNGAVFQLVPQRFAGQIGVITGLVGASGGLGGFLLPLLLGGVRQWTGGFGPAFLLMSLISAGAAGMLVLVNYDWKRSFLARVEAPAVQLVSEPA